MKILCVTGSRDYTDADTVRRVLGGLSFDRLIHGDYRGADHTCRDVCKAEWPHVEVIPFPADWTRYRSGAGPRRNRQMARFCETASGVFGDEVALVVFPGDKGTADMVRQWRKAGLPEPMFVE